MLPCETPESWYTAGNEFIIELLALIMIMIKGKTERLITSLY